MSTAALTQSLLSLPIEARVALADQLYASVPEQWQRAADDAWLEEAHRRSTEMDEDPACEVSHAEFLAALKQQL